MVIKIKVNERLEKPDIYRSAFRYSAAKRIMKYNQEGNYYGE